MKINPDFANSIREIRDKSLGERSHSRKVVHWVEDHRLHSGPGKAIVFILPTKGCSWALSKSGGCSICGYIYDNPQEPNFENMMKTFKEKLHDSIKEGENYSLKLFTSGSFLDISEIPEEIQKEILEEASQYREITEIVLESRPEYVTEKIMQTIKETIDIEKIEIAIGLESANDDILKKSINKGFFWEDFEKAAARIFDVGAKVKAYLLFKPPFVSEYDSIKDILQSVSKLNKLGVDTISINAISIHRGTYLSLMFEKNQYRTPWLWSLLHLCKEIKSKYPDLRLICDVVAGGTQRGAHNCGDCDKQMTEALKQFVLSQNLEDLNNEFKCSCKTEWNSFLLQEKITIS
ncbi:MAG: archaeosine biosynthesis radical SAM protein RaSEA [Candidatus Heimdallarchaeaceae archaeon]